MKEDSLEGIYDALKIRAVISKNAGGIGLNIYCVRASGSATNATNGTSSGIVSMLRVFNNTARYTNQGGNKPPGAFAIYIEPWHADIFSYLDFDQNYSKEELRARDFSIKCVKQNGGWMLMCPCECPCLAGVFGDDFESLYEDYERGDRGRNPIRAQNLWHAIVQAQIETWIPFILYKDACNRKSNQQNLGTIRSSNLCTEIIEYAAPSEVTVCNLASLTLPTYVDMVTKKFDFHELHEVAKVVVRSLNKTVHVSTYPVQEARKINTRHRPIGPAVRALADTFLALRLPFESPSARKLNIQIFETIYHGALTASCELAKQYGAYETNAGSPISRRDLQYDLWDGTPSSTDLWDWTELKKEIARYDVRNSLLIAPMPTASASQILGSSECFEPYTSNMCSRRVLAGEFQVVNSWLVSDLVVRGLWSDNMRNRIVADGDSIQEVQNISAELKALYKTVWEVSQKNIAEIVADRSASIDQSQSSNIHMKEPTVGKITSMHFTGWKLGPKTGMYYLRTMAASAPIQLTIDQEQLENIDTNTALNILTGSTRLGHTPYVSYQIDSFSTE
jgi:ribonucleoside-diphosphate reductase subunit M1